MTLIHMLVLNHRKWQWDFYFKMHIVVLSGYGIMGDVDLIKNIS